MRTPIVMRNDGTISPMKPTDLKEVADRDERIKQLERLNATLSAEVDLQRPVVEAAAIVSRDWASEKKLMNYGECELVATDHVHLDELQAALTAYEAAKEQG